MARINTNVASLTAQRGLAKSQKAMGSTEGRAAAADVPNFATGGVEMVIFDTREV